MIGQILRTLLVPSSKEATMSRNLPPDLKEFNAATARNDVAIEKVKQASDALTDFVRTIKGPKQGGRAGS